MKKLNLKVKKVWSLRRDRLIIPGWYAFNAIKKHEAKMERRKNKIMKIKRFFLIPQIQKLLEKSS